MTLLVTYRVLIAVLLALVAMRLAHRRRLLLTLAWVGIVGAFSNLSALL